MIRLNVDTSALVKYTAKLEQLHRSAFPSAVRGTLNKAAFYMKQSSMPYSADKHFIKRKPNFFKANSKVFMARGFDVGGMQAVFAFLSHNASYNNYAVLELFQQEFGGKIDKRAYIPMDSSRSGDDSSKQVIPSNRLGNIHNIIDASKVPGRSNAEKFTRAAYLGVRTFIGGGGRAYVIGTNSKRILYRVNSIVRTGGDTVIKKTPLYSYRPGRSIGIKGTGFMKEALQITSSKMNKFYIEEAKRQFDKALK